MQSAILEVLALEIGLMSHDVHVAMVSLEHSRPQRSAQAALQVFASPGHQHGP